MAITKPQKTTFAIETRPGRAHLDLLGVELVCQAHALAYRIAAAALEDERIASRAGQRMFALPYVETGTALVVIETATGNTAEASLAAEILRDAASSLGLTEEA